MAERRKSLDDCLFAIVMDNLEKLASYVPGPVKKVGGKRSDLLRRYRADPMFSNFGLDSPEHIGATLSGGTITSIHRQIGDIYEACIKSIFMSAFDQTADELTYQATIVSGTSQETRTADIYLQFDRLDAAARKRISAFCVKEVARLASAPQINLVGVGMEVRHCYQTGDSKRTQADEAMARHLLLSGILPLMPIFCNQSNPTIINRYRSVWVVKQGMESYDMVKQCAEYDLFEFLRRNRRHFRAPVLKLLRSLAS